MTLADAAIEPRAGRTWQAEVDSLRIEARSRFLPFIEGMNPGARERDRMNSPISHDLFERATEIGLLQFSVPTELGGEGRDKFEWGIVMEELATVSRDPSFTVLLDISIETMELILRSGRPDLADRYVGRLLSGRWIATAASYESRDPFDFASTAREVEGDWVLDGTKAFVAAARMADLFVVYVRDAVSNDLLGFLVEREDPGVTISGLDTMGVRSLGLGQISLCQVRLPSERLVWRADALSQMNSYARNRRLLTAASLVGTMDALVTRCVERLGTRIRGGRPVLDYPNVERSIGEMRVAIETSRAIVHHALDATRGPRDRYFDALATAAKHHTADAALRVGQLIMNLQGGEGYMTLQPWERYMRDMLGMIGGQGAQEILLIQLGQRTVVEMDGRQASEEGAERRVARLGASHWALSAAGAALESGLLDEVASPREAQEIAALGETPELLEPVLDLLAATGVVSRGEDGLVVPTDDTRELLGDRARRAELENEVRSTLRAAGDLLAQAREGVLDGESLDALTADHGDLGEPLAALARSSRAFAVLAAALETRLLEELAVLRGPREVSERLNAPEWVVERMLEVLVDAGLVRDEGGTYAPHPGLEATLVSRVRRAELECDARVTLTRRAGPLAGDPELDRLHGGTAAAFCDALFERHLAGLEGLDDLLRERSPRALVAGPGSAALAVELCRWVPTLRVVGLEPRSEDLGREMERVERAGLAGRVEVHELGSQDVAGEGPFALACIATAFHGRDVVAAELARSRDLLADGGWAILLTPRLPRNAVGAAASRLRTAVSGGDPLLDEEGHRRLVRDAGFPLVRALPEVPGLRQHLLAARRLLPGTDHGGT
jgi:alkylation response protein AidB-like acyl-CoA dehydrogenase